MKRILAAMILVPAIAGAQNLVTNATMEQTSWAAFKPRIEKAKGWSNGNGGTADLFKPSEHARKDGIPQNYMGTQASESNYAGIIAYYGDQTISLMKSFESGTFTNEIGYGRYTEYLQGELSEPLVKGRVYTFSFMVSLAEKSDRAVRGLGAYFSTGKLNERGNSFLQVTPQIVSKEVITDMNGWTEIRGMFIAEGGEQYFTIGAFPEHLTVADLSDPNRNDSRKAYYYIARPSLTEGPVLSEPVTRRSISSAAETFDRQGVAYLGINFATGSAEFRPGDYERLNAAAKFLAENPDIEVRIDGHTDATGSAAFNQDLSERRALAVKGYLVNKGIESGRIETAGYGERYPVESTAYESFKNRRIELYRVE